MAELEVRVEARMRPWWAMPLIRVASLLGSLRLAVFALDRLHVEMRMDGGRWQTLPRRSIRAALAGLRDDDDMVRSVPPPP